MFHGHETHCFMRMKHIESGTATTDISMFYIDFWFMVFDGVSLRYCMLFHCCFMLFHAVSRCVTAVFHAVSLLFHYCFIAVSCCFIAVLRCFIALFHGVSRCFIALFHLFHDHETGAVGTSL